MRKLLRLTTLMILLLAFQLQAQPANPPTLETFTVQNPTSGVDWFVQALIPFGNGTSRYPALVLVPGGSSAGTQAFRPPEVTRYTDLGFVSFVFDPDGRGRTGGTEDNNGFTHQDGLRAVIEAAATHPRTNGRVVVASFSYGVTMASGTLARYPQLPVDFFMDWEGPANRDDTGGCDGAGLGHLQSFGCTDETFWAEREASTFMRSVEVPYQRLQTERDHVQPDNLHALLLVNNATEGSSPWTRLNDLTPNQVFPSTFDEGWLPENQPLPDVIVEYLSQYLAGSVPASVASSDQSSTAFTSTLQIGMSVHLEGWPLEQEAAFNRYADLNRQYADLFERYGAKLTLESKEPTVFIPEHGDNFLAELEARGHGVGVHADLGGNSARPNYGQDQFVRDMRIRKVNLDALVSDNRHLSGICSQLDWVSAAVEAGYEFTSGVVAYCYTSLAEEDRPEAYRDCQNAAECHQPFSFELKDRIHPWRARDGLSWTTHDPEGELVILPQTFTLNCFAEALVSNESVLGCEFTADDIEAFIQELEHALSLADPNQTNIFYVVWSFGGQLDMNLLERWLQAIVPYVDSGQVVWRTLPQMYDNYLAWEARQ